MKVAILSDIHGNQVALDAVLDNLPEIDEIVSLGDVVGYGPNPKETCKTIREAASVSLLGNHETYLDNPNACSANTQAYEGIKHANSELTTEQKEWLTNRPYKDTIDDTITIAHGHPSEETPFRYVRRSNVTELIPILREYDTDILAVGHSHIQFKQDLTRFHENAGVVFNPGSVGQPRDGDPKAGYAIVNTETEEIELNRVEYDIEETGSRIEAAGLPNGTATRLTRGK